MILRINPGRDFLPIPAVIACWSLEILHINPGRYCLPLPEDIASQSLQICLSSSSKPQTIMTPVSKDTAKNSLKYYSLIHADSTHRFLPIIAPNPSFCHYFQSLQTLPTRFLHKPSRHSRTWLPSTVKLSLKPCTDYLEISADIGSKFMKIWPYNDGKYCLPILANILPVPIDIAN